MTNVKAGRINVVSFSKYEYNAFNKNWSVDFDRNGNAYFANDEGLLTFDGANWKLYKLPNYGIVRSVYVSDNDLIYVGSYEEFGYFEKDNYGQLHYYSLKDKVTDFTFHNNEIWQIYENEQSEIIFQSFDAIFIYGKNGIRIVPTDDPILFLLEARGRYFAKTFYTDFLEFKNDSFTTIPQNILKDNVPLRTVLPFKKDEFLLGSRNGLIIWDNHSFKNWDSPIQQEIYNKDINVGLVHGENYIIGTLKGGIYIFDEQGNVIHHLNTDNYLNTNTIYDLRFDSKQRLWYTSNKGVGYIDFNFPFTFIADDRISIGMVHSAKVHNNILYLATNQGVYYHPYNADELDRLEISDFKLIEGSIGQSWQLAVYDDQLLCGHNHGTFIIENDQFIKISEKNAAYSFRLLNVDDESKLVLCTHNNLLLLKKDQNQKWIFDKILRGFNLGIKNIEVDHNNFIWGSHFIQKSIMKLRIDPNDSNRLLYDVYGTNKGLPSNYGNDVFKIFNNVVFSTQKGFYAYDSLNDTIIPYTKLNTELQDFANSSHLFKGPDKSFWFINGSRIGYFKMQSGVLKKEFQYDFNESGTGLVEKFENIIPIDESMTIICLENGIAVYNPKEDLIRNSFTYPINLSEIEIINRKDELRLLDTETDKTELRYPVKRIEFSFSSMSAPGRNARYQYKMEGVDKDWSKLSSSTSTVYQKLPYGDYTFRIKGIDGFGNELPTRDFSFKILPPWYQTKTSISIFILCLVLFFLSLPFGIKRYIKAHKRKLDHEQVRIIEEKEKEQRYQAEQIILQNKLEHQSSQLASSTMAIINKNEALTEIKEEVEKKKKKIAGRLPDNFLEPIINLINKNIEHQSDWETFQTHFDNAHSDFFIRLKEQHPNLTPKDLRLCAYLRMNLSSKEIAPLLNISIRSVEVHRYRIRKKLELNPHDNLTEMMLNF